MHLVEISFKGNRKEFFVWEGDEPPHPKAAVIVEADRGEDLGHVHSVGDLAAVRCGGCSHGCGPEQPKRKVLRVATDEERRRSTDLRTQDEDARRRAMERVRSHGLVMKVSDAEWQWDRRKLTFYFTAEKRVDFRALVRDLASTFRTRIELKQIGVRDEAKRLSGIGRCGREYCSASWLPDLRPVNLQIAKDQRLSLNPSQISGACGRLMCCLRYEHDFYVQARKRFPKEGRILVTARGEEKVVVNDIFSDRVTLRGADGETRVVPLAELKQELEAEGADVAATAGDGGGTLDEAPGGGGEPGEPLYEEDVLLLDEAPSSSRPRPSRSRRPEAITQRPPVDPPRSDAEPAKEGEQDRRPHRRRGRRGGRRSRPNGDSPRIVSEE
ncbi:MAG TPA: regulatory iron-sulfur-containing complex subunit RicT [Gemmatimonadaceae bacterium]|nr:regulatory iron-sulfur-containing complex subunit RicT [Gemmatimonadaceae bacterium]